MSVVIFLSSYAAPGILVLGEREILLLQRKCLFFSLLFLHAAPTLISLQVPLVCSSLQFLSFLDFSFLCCLSPLVSPFFLSLLHTNVSLSLSSFSWDLSTLVDTPLSCGSSTLRSLRIFSFVSLSSSSWGVSFYFSLCVCVWICMHRYVWVYGCISMCTTWEVASSALSLERIVNHSMDIHMYISTPLHLCIWLCVSGYIYIYMFRSGGACMMILEDVVEPPGTVFFILQVWLLLLLFARALLSCRSLYMDRNVAFLCIHVVCFCRWL